MNSLIHGIIKSKKYINNDYQIICLTISTFLWRTILKIEIINYMYMYIFKMSNCIYSNLYLSNGAIKEPVIILPRFKTTSTSTRKFFFLTECINSCLFSTVDQLWKMMIKTSIIGLSMHLALHNNENIIKVASELYNFILHDESYGLFMIYFIPSTVKPLPRCQVVYNADLLFCVH